MFLNILFCANICLFVIFIDCIGVCFVYLPVLYSINYFFVF